MSDSPGPAGPDPLSGLRILVVEDEAMIGMLIEDVLSEHGAIVLGPAKRVAEALELAAAEAIDLAVLDLNLAGEAAYPVAEALAARGVPFLFMTGYGQHGIDGAWRDRPALAKPFRPSELAQMICAIVAAGR